MTGRLGAASFDFDNAVVPGRGGEIRLLFLWVTTLSSNPMRGLTGLVPLILAFMAGSGMASPIAASVPADAEFACAPSVEDAGHIAVDSPSTRKGHWALEGEPPPFVRDGGRTASTPLFRAGPTAGRQRLAGEFDDRSASSRAANAAVLNATHALDLARSGFLAHGATAPPHSS